MHYNQDSHFHFIESVILLMLGQICLVSNDKHHLCVSSGCMYQSQECRLVIHYEQGFSVLADPRLDHGENGGAGGAPSPTSPRVLLSYPYEKLKMSSDDGVRTLSLDFGGKEGEIVSVFF